MRSYIKGVYKKAIFTSDKGYFIGLFKVSETDNELLKDFIDKTITLQGILLNLMKEILIVLKEKKWIILVMDYSLVLIVMKK